MEQTFPMFAQQINIWSPKWLKPAEKHPLLTIYHFLPNPLQILVHYPHKILSWANSCCELKCVCTWKAIHCWWHWTRVFFQWLNGEGKTAALVGKEKTRDLQLAEAQTSLALWGLRQVAETWHWGLGTAGLAFPVCCQGWKVQAYGEHSKSWCLRVWEATLQNC